MGQYRYLPLVLLFVLCAYMLKICVRDFRRTRGSGTFKPYLYALGAAFSMLMIGFAVIVALLLFIRPFH